MSKKFVYSLVVILIIIVALIIFNQPANDQIVPSQGNLMDLPESGLYLVDAENSKLLWSSSFLVGNLHTGSVDISSGQVIFSEKNLKEGEIEIDMTSIKEDKNDEKFLAHMASEDFFSVEEFPTADISLSKIEKSEISGNYVVTGDLTIRNITNSISFPVSLNSVGDGIRVKSEFEIDRTLWGINFRSGSFFKDLGDKAIKDEIKFDLDLILKK